MALLEMKATAQGWNSTMQSPSQDMDMKHNTVRSSGFSGVERLPLHRTMYVVDGLNRTVDPTVNSDDAESHARCIPI